jgi:heme O synthase-like polyprenyltransferase
MPVLNPLKDLHNCGVDDEMKRTTARGLVSRRCEGRGTALGAILDQLVSVFFFAHG